MKALPCAALAAALGLGACSSSGSGSGTSTSTTVKQTIPTNADATPSGTVSSYLGALSRHDYTLAKMFLRPKVETSIVNAAGSGFEHLGSLVDIKVGAAQTGKQFRPTVDGDSFNKDVQFARVTVSYTATFTSGSGSGPQSRIVTLGENVHSKWTILAIRTS